MFGEIFKITQRSNFLHLGIVHPPMPYTFMSAIPCKSNMRASKSVRSLRTNEWPKISTRDIPSWTLEVAITNYTNNKCTRYTISRVYMYDYKRDPNWPKQRFSYTIVLV